VFGRVEPQAQPGSVVPESVVEQVDRPLSVADLAAPALALGDDPDP